MKVTVKKVHGSGNDFYIIDEMMLSEALPEEQRRQLALTLCDRQQSLGGADGILYVSASETALARMRVINSDGSEASMCGNGLRTVARYLAQKHQLTNFTVETMKAVLNVAEDEPLAEGLPTYRVEISPVTFAKETLPLVIEGEQLYNERVPAFSKHLSYSAVAVPNPHLISFVEAADFADQEKLARWLNSENPYFTDGVNVSYVRRFNENAIFVKTYERGVGFTNACGTAMSASSLMARLIHGGDFNRKIDVYNPGGRVQCQVYREANSYRIDLIGNATFVFEAELVTTADAKAVTVISQTMTDEQVAYERLSKTAAQFVAAQSIV